MSTGKAAVFFGPGRPFEIRELPLPDVEPDAVLIRVSLANVCTPRRRPASRAPR
jgi:D-arabinose 1-dehydrogenase-like Zn-dependent alcohol dehydrogenase